MVNDPNYQLKLNCVTLELANAIARKVLVEYAYLYFKTRREFWNTFLTLCAAQRDEACIDTFGTLPTELLACISMETEKQTIRWISNMDFIDGMPFLASLLGIDTMIYAAVGSSTMIPCSLPDEHIFVFSVEVSTPNTMDAYHRIEEIYD
jgi:hypothetical protein